MSDKIEETEDGYYEMMPDGVRWVKKETTTEEEKEEE